jgi:shikimate kinase
MKTFLLGLPGSGKTTLGRELARVLKVPFLDLDEEIQKEAGLSVKEIFAKDGEEHFRRTESLILKKWCANSDSFVMATGGGAPCFFDNMERIKKAGISFFLDVPVDEIVKRMDGEGISHRPLLSGSETVSEVLRRLRNQRLSFYGQATYTYSGKNIALQILEKKITSEKETRK